MARTYPKEGFARLEECLGDAARRPWQNAAPVDEAPIALAGPRVSWRLLALESEPLQMQKHLDYKCQVWSVEGRSLKSHLPREDKHLGLFPQSTGPARINGSQYC